MFIEFTFSNFRSFRDTATLSMVADKLKSKYANLDRDNVFETAGGLKLLRSKAIYGANASGKSNVAKAMQAFRHLLNENVHSEAVVSETWNERFKLRVDEDIEPVTFQYTFLCNNIEYRYGFEIFDDTVRSEWLFGKVRKREAPYFIKEGSNMVCMEQKHFGEVLPFIHLVNKGKGQLFRKDSLFLLALAANGDSLSQELLATMRLPFIIYDVNDDNMNFLVVHKINSSDSFKKQVLFLLNSADINITDVEEKEMEPQELFRRLPELATLPKDRVSFPKVLQSTRTIHNHGTEESKTIKGYFEEWESAGTQKFFYLGALVLIALQEGRPFIIDEFDARLHPRLSQKIVDLFNNPKTNPHGAQLIFITHDVGLLKPYKLRRDQIAFVDKDKDGSSTLTTLAEFKGVRNDASYDKEYMQGAYGGVPDVNEMESVVTQSVNSNEPQAD